MRIVNRLISLTGGLASRGLLSTVRVSLLRCHQEKILTGCVQQEFRNLSLVHVNSWGAGRKYIWGYEDIEELKSAPEEVQRIFSLKNASMYELRKVAIKDAKKEFDHPVQKKIAALSVQIEAVKKNNEEGVNARKDKHNKVFLNWLIHRRLKKLAILRKYEFERYIATLKALDIPMPPSPIAKENKYKFRKFKIGVEIKEKRPVRGYKK